MIRLIWSWIMKWGWDYNRNLREADVPIAATRSKAGRLVARDDIDSDQGLNITVRNAMGGKIITFRHYDQKTDRHHHRLYVIPDDMDFNSELCKMITLESMRG